MTEALTRPLSENELALAQERLLALLARQMRRYTMAESSSLPEETAQELLHSLCYVLQISRQPDGSWRRLLSADPRELWRQGQQALAEKTALARQQWQALCLAPPPARNVFYDDTLRELGLFFHRYDREFRAAEIPCAIDYQPARPVAEELPGIDYVLTWLERIGWETGLLRAFAPGPVGAVLAEYSPDPTGLPLNMCEPVFTAALDRALLGLEPGPLLLNAAERRELAEILAPLGQAQLTAVLSQYTEMLLRRCQTKPDICMTAYFTALCPDLAVRLIACR